LLRRAETTGIFQLESRGMKDLIRRLLPDNINDIIALVALFRPGPLQSGAVDDYINRKHGKEPVSFPHPTLDTVLEGTYGVVLYQEQVMQIAQVLAGFSLGQADLLRRAMGKKKAEEMAKVRAQFLQGTGERAVDADLANEIFDLMEKFAGYAFNKSHSATYALLSFQTAWLKTHYPADFLAANLSADMQNIDRVVVLVDEVRRMKLDLLPPSVNKSEFRFCAQDGAVIYGLGAVRGVGEGPVEAIVAARQAAPFKDLADF
jgi:DNA polymerase-3 subunit alpha